MKTKIAEIEPYENEIRRLKTELRKEKAKVSHLEARLRDLVKPNKKLENLKHDIRAIARDNKVSGDSMLDIALNKLNKIVDTTLK